MGVGSAGSACAGAGMWVCWSIMQMSSMSLYSRSLRPRFRISVAMVCRVSLMRSISNITRISFSRLDFSCSAFFPAEAFCGVWRSSRRSWLLSVAAMIWLRGTFRECSWNWQCISARSRVWSLMVRWKSIRPRTPRSGSERSM